MSIRRQWPISPYRQVEQAHRDLKPLTFDGDWFDRMYAQLQSQEYDTYKDMFLGSWNKIQQSGLSGGFRRGDFTTIVSHHPREHLNLARRLQALSNNGAVKTVRLCLEGSYQTYHFDPYHDLDKIRMEASNVVIRPSNW